MPLKNGSYYGKTAAPQYQTYPTAGLLKPTPLPSVTPAPKPSNEGGFAGVSPVNPETVGPIVGPPAPTVPAIMTPPAPGAVAQAPQGPQPSGRQQLISAIMGRSRVVEQ